MRGPAARRPGASPPAMGELPTLPRVAGRAPIHLRPATDLAERVLLPGDPHRALAVAQAVLEKPLMFNHARGLWGYTGTAPDGVPLSVQSTGMGGPSAAIVIEELIDLGARALVRIGTCGALAQGLELGALVTAGEVLAGDGVERRPRGRAAALPRSRADPCADRRRRARRDGGLDRLFYDPREGIEAEWRAGGVDVIEMEAATLLAVSARRRGAGRGRPRRE